MTWELALAAALGHFIEVWGATIIDAVARALIRIIDSIERPSSGGAIDEPVSHDPRVDVLMVALDHIDKPELKIALVNSVDNIITQRPSTA